MTHFKGHLCDPARRPLIPFFDLFKRSSLSSAQCCGIAPLPRHIGEPSQSRTRSSGPIPIRRRQKETNKRLAPHPQISCFWVGPSLLCLVQYCTAHGPQRPAILTQGCPNGIGPPSSPPPPPPRLIHSGSFGSVCRRWPEAQTLQTNLFPMRLLVAAFCHRMETLFVALFAFLVHLPASTPCCNAPLCSSGTPGRLGRPRVTRPSGCPAWAEGPEAGRGLLCLNCIAQHMGHSAKSIRQTNSKFSWMPQAPV